MWSDRPSPARRQELVAALRSVLPPPRPTASTSTVPLCSSLNPVRVAAGLQESPGFAWLDHTTAQGRLLFDPLVRISVSDQQATVRGPLADIAIDARAFDLVEAALDAWAGPRGAVLCGYLGYELGAEIEGIPMPPRRSADLPDMVLWLYDFVVDYSSTGWSPTGTDAWRGDHGLPFPACEIEARLQSPSSAPTPGVRAGTFVSSPTGEGFKTAVERIVRRIYEGEVFQVNICRRLEAELDGAGIWPAYLRLRSLSPASQGAFLRLGPAQAVLSVSPELFLAVDNGIVRSCPIKGTRKRGTTPEEDERISSELEQSEKDRAELAMIVDVVRSDLSRVCVPGTVTVASHAQPMALPTVHHLFSAVTGRLRKAAFADLLRACSPAASISGAPKIHAIELAAIEEGGLRGPCMGAIGWLCLDGRMELSVAIRTAVASEGRIWYLAGCGITAESNPEEELAESEAKAVAFLRALTP